MMDHGTDDALEWLLNEHDLRTCRIMDAQVIDGVWLRSSVPLDYW